MGRVLGHGGLRKPSIYTVFSSFLRHGPMGPVAPRTVKSTNVLHYFSTWARFGRNGTSEFANTTIFIVFSDLGFFRVQMDAQNGEINLRITLLFDIAKS